MMPNSFRSDFDVGRRTSELLRESRATGQAIRALTVKITCSYVEKSFAVMQKNSCEANYLHSKFSEECKIQQLV